MPQLDQFTIDIPNSTSQLDLTIHRSADPAQRQYRLGPNDHRVELVAPMIFWADCRLHGDENMVAVGWSQTMTSIVVEFCYATSTHGCIAELDLNPCPCNDGGAGIWYGGVNTMALQFLGPGYDRHDNDLVFFTLYHPELRTAGATAFNQSPGHKRVWMKDAPFVQIPEDATCRVGNRHIPEARQGQTISLRRVSPLNTVTNNPLFHNSALECVKAQYKFDTYFCALKTNNAQAVPGLTDAPAFAKVQWEISYAVYFNGVALTKMWESVGPLKIRNVGAKFKSYQRLDGREISRRQGVSCNQGARQVVFDYRALQSLV